MSVPLDLSTFSKQGDIGYSLYGYTPSLVSAVIFIIIFSVLTLYHIYLVRRSKVIWLAVGAIGGFLEIMGHCARLWSVSDPQKDDPFLMQIITTILAPVMFSAFLYGVSAMLIVALGSEYSKLRPSRYMLIFCTCDAISLIAQAAGGAMAALALKKLDFTPTGTNIMVGGIAFQFSATLVFAYLLFNFFLGARKAVAYAARTSFDQGRIKRLVRGLFIASTLILIRCLYRTIELSQGWAGYFISHEVWFIVLDAIPMVLTLAALIYAHPVYCLLAADEDKLAEGQQTPGSTFSTLEKNESA